MKIFLTICYVVLLTYSQIFSSWRIAIELDQSALAPRAASHIQLEQRYTHQHPDAPFNAAIIKKNYENKFILDHMYSSDPAQRAVRYSRYTFDNLEEAQRKLLEYLRDPLHAPYQPVLDKTIAIEEKKPKTTRGKHQIKTDPELHAQQRRNALSSTNFYIDPNV